MHGERWRYSSFFCIMNNINYWNIEGDRMEGTKKRKPRMPGETEKSENKNEEYYNYADIARRISKDEDIIKSGKDISTIEKNVSRYCNSLVKFWGLDELKEYIQSELFLDRIADVLIEMMKDSSVIGIINKINKGNDIKKEEAEKLNSFKIYMLSKGKTIEEQEKIREMYKIKSEELEKVREMKEEIEESFKVSLDIYINEILKNNLNMQKSCIEIISDELSEINQQVLQIINGKTNEIIYKDKVNKLINTYIQKVGINFEEIDIEELKKEIKSIGQLHGVDSTNTINEIYFLKNN